VICRHCLEILGEINPGPVVHDPIYADQIKQVDGIDYLEDEESERIHGLSCKKCGCNIYGFDISDGVVLAMAYGYLR
jgi:hypothetical protein